MTPVLHIDEQVANQVPLSPIVADGVIFASRTTDWTDPTADALFAMDVDTGAYLWSTTLPIIAGSPGTISHPIAYRDGVLYATRCDDYSTYFGEYLYALDAATGNLLWTSQDLIGLSWWGSPAFTPDGDILISTDYNTYGTFKTLRIDAATGATVWNMSQGGGPYLAGGSVHGDLWYDFDPAYTRVRRRNMNTGQIMYFSVSLGGDTPNGPMMIDAEGTLYVSYTVSGGTSAGTYLAAIEDLGGSFQVRWTVPAWPGDTSAGAIGPDGSIYFYSDDGRIVRLDPQTGAVLASSAVLLPGMFSTRISIDEHGKVFALISSNYPATLYAMTPDLQVSWTLNTHATPNGGPCLSADGSLILVDTSGVQSYRDHAGCNEESYCVAATNSTGVGAAISLDGSLSVSSNDLALLTSDLPAGQPGIYFYGAGQQQVAFGNGFLCVAAPIFRMAPIAADASGEARMQLDLSQLSAGGDINPGSTWNFQFWYRDPAAGGAFFNASGGLSLRFCP